MADNNDIRKVKLDTAIGQQTELKSSANAAKKAYEDASRKLIQLQASGRSSGLANTNYTSQLTAASKAAQEAKKAYDQANNAYSSFQKNEDTGGKFISETQKIIGQETKLFDDAAAASQNVDKLGLDLTLDRIRDDASVSQARDAYAKATDLSLVRDAATERLQGAEQSTNRQLLARLGQAGVKGGLAGGALTDMASMNLRNRASLERDLAVQNVSANQQRAQFETQLAQFDIGQAAAESVNRNLVKGMLIQNSTLQRAGEKQKDIASSLGTMAGSSGTVLCTAMFHHGLISPDVFYCDIEAGRKFLLNKQTRKAFLKYNKVCKPIANFAIKHYWFALLISPIIVPIAKHFSDNNKVGKFLFAALSAPFKFIARF